MSPVVFTLADAGRGDQALNLMAGIAAHEAAGRMELQTCIVDCGLSDVQRKRAAAAGIAAPQARIDPALAWPDAQSAYMWQRYFCGPLIEKLGEWFWYVDADVVLDGPGICFWVTGEHGRLIAAHQPQTWFTLLRGHGISGDQGLGSDLYRTILSSGCWAADHKLLKKLGSEMGGELARARANDWRHWAEECGFNRAAMRLYANRQVVVAPPTMHWQAGFGFHVLDGEGTKGPRDQGTEGTPFNERRIVGPPGGFPCTPAGDRIRLLHFGGAGNADQVGNFREAAMTPWPYLERDGRWHGENAERRTRNAEHGTQAAAPPACGSPFPVPSSELERSDPC